MMRRSALLLLAVAAFSTQTAALSGNQLLAFSEEQPMAAALYVGGATDALVIERARYRALVNDADNDSGSFSLLVKNAPRAFCIPSTGVTNGQIYDVVIRDLKAKPESRHLPAVLLLADSLADAFRCTK